MEKKTGAFGWVSWLTKLEKGERQVAMLLIAVLFLASSLIKVLLLNDSLNAIIRKKDDQNLTDRIGCEQRVALEKDATAMRIELERKRSDSALKSCEDSKQAIFLTRINSIKKQNSKIDKNLQ